MARRLSWSDVRGGAIAALAIALLAFLTLKYSRLGALHGDTFRLYALVGEARGVLVGSEVWLSGQKIGKITDIKFRSPSQSTVDSRIELEMQALEEHRGAMHQDAVGQIRSGGSFIGAPVMYINPGTVKTPLIRDGDTLHTAPQTDAEGATAQFGLASREFPVIISNVKLLTVQLKGTEGTIGAMLNSPEGGRAVSRLGSTKEHASRVMGSFSNGTIGTSHREALMQRARNALARADSVRASLGAPRSSATRIRSDSILSLTLKDLQNELSIVRSELDSDRGTIPRARTDSLIFENIHSAEAQMTLLIADVKKHPLRYLRF